MAMQHAGSILFNYSKIDLIAIYRLGNYLIAGTTELVTQQQYISIKQDRSIRWQRV